MVPQLWYCKFLLFNPLSLWYFVKAALADQHKAYLTENSKKKKPKKDKQTSNYTYTSIYEKLHKSNAMKFFSCTFTTLFNLLVLFFT
jgi:hypothetical protein